MNGFIRSDGVQSRLQINRALSSVGSEHLPYKQGVTGSNPVGPTSSRKPRDENRGVLFWIWSQKRAFVSQGQKRSAIRASGFGFSICSRGYSQDHDPDKYRGSNPGAFTRAFEGNENTSIRVTGSGFLFLPMAWDRFAEGVWSESQPSR